MFRLMEVANCYNATLHRVLSFDPNDWLMTLKILGSVDIAHSDNKESDSWVFFFFLFSFFFFLLENRCWKFI